MNHRNDNPPRSPSGLLRGGHTRSVCQTVWGKMDAASATNAPGRGAPSYTVIGSHADAPAKPLPPGASEGNPRGFGPAGKGSR
jgi:hypothetical protein